MAKICTSVTTWVTKEILDPVDTWVSTQEEKCKKKKWWNPATWFCWFVTFLIKVIIWVVRNILVPSIKIICVVIFGTIGIILYPFAWAIDSLCQNCNVHTWVETWWLSCTKVTFIKKEKSQNYPDSYDYTFKCNCTCFKYKEITFTAKNDDDAAIVAVAECKKKCL
jgi:hypothetical protein